METNLVELNDIEITVIEGGSFWKDLGYGIGVFARGCVEFASGASAGSQVNGGIFYK